MKKSIQHDRNSSSATALGGVKKKSEAIIVGAATGIEVRQLEGADDTFAINSAYFYLKEHGIAPSALITGDKRFIARTGVEKMSQVNRVITFLDSDPHVNKNHTETLPNVELYRCAGRDGFSSDHETGFFHGCSTFFFAIQYLIACGYTKIKTIGIHFPPPEKYSRLSGITGHPEFVYDIQLKNLASLKKFLQVTNTEVNCLDSHSNLNIFL